MHFGFVHIDAVYNSPSAEHRLAPCDLIEASAGGQYDDAGHADLSRVVGQGKPKVAIRRGYHTILLSLLV